MKRDTQANKDEVRRMKRSVMAASESQSKRLGSFLSDWFYRHVVPTAPGRCRPRRKQIGAWMVSVYSRSSSSRRNCFFKWRRAAFLIARRSAATPCFSAWRSRRVRGSADCDTCLICGRRAPIFRSFGLAYGSMRIQGCLFAIK